MTKQEMLDREYAKMIAIACFENEIDKLYQYYGSNTN